MEDILRVLVNATVTQQKTTRMQREQLKTQQQASQALLAQVAQTQLDTQID